MKATNNTEDLRRIITRRREQALDRSDFISLTVRLAVVVLAGWVLFTQVFLITQASGSAMFPSVKDGDLLIGFRLQQTYQKGDVVIYHQDGNIRVGRICANSTDYVDIDEEGVLLVNGTVQSGEILYPTYAKEGLTYPVQVPQGCVFILGDYRTQSQDSRDFGPVPLDNVQAKVITILRRRGL